MPCGVTKSTSGGTAVCDNAGTSGHAGRHSGVVTFEFRGFTLSSTRVYWLAADAVPATQSAIVRGTAY